MIAKDEKIARSVGGRAAVASTNLPIVEEDAASSEVAAVYADFRIRFGRADVPGILKCFATHPLLLRHMMDIAEGLIFADGHLARRHKEMIATLVSSQNSCAYCADSHGYALRMNGGSAEALCAIQQNDLHSPSLSEAERALLGYVEKINRSSHDLTRGDVETLLAAGWSELQVAEAVHVVAMFATYNRVVNAFGLKSQGLLGHASDAQAE